MPSGMYSNDAVRPVLGFLSISSEGRLETAEGYLLPDVVEVDGVKYVDLPEGFLTFKSNIGKMVRLIDLLAYAFKKPYLRESELKFIECLPINGNFDDLSLENLVWKFPKGSVECTVWPGFRYIPGYTRYVIREKAPGEFEILNLAFGTKKNQGANSTGYLGMSLAADGSVTNQGVALHRAIALTYSDYPLNVKELVADHINDDRTDNRKDNFQWLGFVENLKKGSENYNRVVLKNTEKTWDTEPQNKVLTQRKKIKVLNLETNEISVWEHITELLRALNIRDWQVRQSIANGERGAIGVVNGRYIFRYEEHDFPEVTLKDINNRSYRGPQKRPALLKNAYTQEVKEFESAKSLVSSTGLSKKVVTSRLVRGKQSIPNTPWLVKYKDNPSPWVS